MKTIYLCHNAEGKVLAAFDQAHLAHESYRLSYSAKPDAAITFWRNTEDKLVIRMNGKDAGYITEVQLFPEAVQI